MHKRPGSCLVRDASHAQRSRCPRLPDEVLAYVLLFLQPHFEQQESDLTASSIWKDGTCKVGREVWRESLGRRTVEHDWHSQYGGRERFHPTIEVTRVPSRGYCMPALLSVGAVSRQWRRAALEHPFWTELAWHRLLDFKPRSLVVDEDQPAAFDEFFTALAAEPYRMSRIRTIRLDISNWQRYMSAEVLRSVLGAITRLERIDTVVLETTWDVAGDEGVARFIAQLPNLKRLHVGGQPIPTAYHGLGSRILRHWRKRWTPDTLTHLSLQGWGTSTGGRFTASNFLALLSTQSTIKHLFVSADWPVISLLEVARILPNLGTLAVQIPPRNDAAYLSAVSLYDVSGFARLTTLSVLSGEPDENTAPSGIIVSRILGTLTDGCAETIQDLRIPYFNRPRLDAEINFAGCDRVTARFLSRMTGLRVLHVDHIVGLAPDFSQPQQAFGIEMVQARRMGWLEEW
ncbi:hypothetical protein HKX48_008638 [Thoreauomyces humboldtii]|nr:hypothetical protein HKX48_008638 [Thoreauomyces humboldtii]